MSKVLRRPMFRGGRVDSRGTGITSGLDEGYADGGRVGFQGGGDYFTNTQFGRVLSDVGLMGRGILSDLYNVAGVPTNIATEFFTGYNPGFSGERIFGLEGKRDPLRFSTFEPGKSKFFGYSTSSVPGRAYTENMYDKAIQEGLDITRSKPFEVSDEASLKPKAIETSGEPAPRPKDINEITREDLEKEVQTYSKLLGGDEAKSQALYDALLAASPAFFKGKNLREAAPEVLTAINKSGAFDKPRDIRQAAAQLAIQRRMLVDKAREEAKTKEQLIALGIAGKQKTFGETVSEYLEKGNPITENFLYSAAIDKIPNFKGKVYAGQKLDPNSIYLDKLSFYKTDAEGNLIQKPVLDYRSVASK
jgi:hypothetical protein